MSELDNLRAANIAYSQQVNDLIGRVGNLEAQLACSEDHAREWEHHCKTASDECDRLREQRDAARAQVTKLHAQFVDGPVG